MARRRLEVGELGTVRTQKLDNGTVRAFVQVRCRDDKVRQVQGDGPSAVKATARAKANARRRAHVADSLSPESKLNLVCELWIDERHDAGEIGDSTAEAYRGDVRRMNGEHGIGDMPLGECTPEIVQGWLKNLSRSKPATAKRAKTLLRGAFGLADERGVGLERWDPVGNVRLHKSATPRPKAVSLEDLEALRERALDWQEGGAVGGRQRWRFLTHSVDVMLGCGCRPGELLALRWRDVDLSSNPATVTIYGTVKRTGGKLYRQPWTKTDAGYRVVKLPRFATAALLDVKVRSAPNALDLVFPNATGGLMELNNYGRRWREVRGEEYAWVEPRSFRRTVATLVSREMDAEAAQRVLGHASSATTERHYIERAPAIAPDVSAALERFAPRQNTG